MIENVRRAHSVVAMVEQNSLDELDRAISEWRELLPWLELWGPQMVATVIERVVRAGQPQLAARMLSEISQFPRLLPAWEVLMTRPGLAVLHDEPGFDALLRLSRERLEGLLPTLEEARLARELPAYLEEPLSELMVLLDEDA